MIIDKIANLDKYSKFGVRFNAGLKFLLDDKISQLRDGIHRIKGRDLYANILTYETRRSRHIKFESHRNYIDIQYLLKGREIIEWAPVAGLRVAKKYLRTKDVVFYNTDCEKSSLVMEPGIFAVFYPMDAHRPGCMFKKKGLVHKVVVKVRV